MVCDVDEYEDVPAHYIIQPHATVRPSNLFDRYIAVVSYVIGGEHNLQTPVDKYTYYVLEF